ncbi:MAG: TrmH family RNA methyltransferase [Clostridiales bacterium]|nr:TrmH family RNA methyltransferase [Clostridiales bacterium]
MPIKKYKKTDDISYALGATVTMELLNRRAECVRRVYVSPKSDVTAVVEKASSLGVEIVESEKAFNILSPKENCFVIGEFSKFTSHAATDRHHVVLVNPSNSGNLGTIMRDVAAFDCADLVIIRPAVDNFDPKTVRASMGAVFGINVELFDSFEQYINKYPNRAIMPFMLNGCPFGKTGFGTDKKYSLVFGNEATGLPESYSKYNAVRIEQSEKVDSLNLSVAVSVALYKLYTA